jgi:formate dehydrogenase subunit delta
MDVERLAQMANDIGNYFTSDPDREAGIAGMVSHIERFWEPRMRKQITAHLEHGGEGLSDIARAAITRLAGGSKVY